MTEREEAEQENLARDTCMCGDPIKDHASGWVTGHNPVSMYDYLYREIDDG